MIHFEGLESRTHFSAVHSTAAVHFVDGALRVQGTLDNDVIRLGTSNGQLVARINGRAWWYPLNILTSISVKGFGGADDIRIGMKVPPAEVDGGAGSDTIVGGGMSDTLSAGGGDNTLHGRGENDLLLSSVGQDSLIAGGEGDTLIGGSGPDTFRAAPAGGDMLLGGSGNDVFYARDTTGDTVVGGSGQNSAQVDSLDSISNIQTLLS